MMEKRFCEAIRGQVCVGKRPRARARAPRVASCVQLRDVESDAAARRPVVTRVPPSGQSCNYDERKDTLMRRRDTFFDRRLVNRNENKMNNLQGAVAVALTILAVASLVLGETCQKPQVSASAYVTEDATILTNVAFTTQFTLKCSNGAKDISLYAEVEGRALPAVRLSADNKYQVSWTDDAKNARSGDYGVKLYDEESYAAIRKAHRNGEDPESVEPLAVVVLNNPGVYRGAWIHSELVAAALAALVSYAAFSAKSKLVAERVKGADQK